MLYTVKNRVEEFPEMEYNDGVMKLHSNVERLRGSSRIGVKYMNMQEVIKYKILDTVEERGNDAGEIIFFCKSRTRGRFSG